MGHNIASNRVLAVVDEKRAHILLTKRYLPARDRLIVARERIRAAAPGW